MTLVPQIAGLALMLAGDALAVSQVEHVICMRPKFR